MKHSFAEWCGAITASACVGGAVAIVICAALAVGSHLYPVEPGLLLNAAYIVGALLGTGTAVHFLRLFREGEVESREIWRSVGKAFLASGDD
jgi:hypothetical protein